MADELKAPRNYSEQSETAVLCRPPPSEIRLRKAISGPARLPSRPKVVSIGAEDGLGQVVKSLQMAFHASACVSFSGAHADQEGPVTGLSQQQFPACFPGPFTQAPLFEIVGFNSREGRTGH